jgi:hypothetical protein
MKTHSAPSLAAGRINHEEQTEGNSCTGIEEDSRKWGDLLI